MFSLINGTLLSISVIVPCQCVFWGQFACAWLSSSSISQVVWHVCGDIWFYLIYLQDLTVINSINWLCTHVLFLFSSAFAQVWLNQHYIFQPATHLLTPGTWLFLLLDMNLDLDLMQHFVSYMFRPFILNHKGNGWIYSNHSSNFLSNHLMNLWFIDLNGSDKHVAWLMVFDLISACVLPRHDPAQGSLCSPQS